MALKGTTGTPMTIHTRPGKTKKRRKQQDPHPNSKRGKQLANLQPLPQHLMRDTRCSYPLALHPRHSTHSATQRQRSFLQKTLQRNGYQPAGHLCCSNQAAALIKWATGKRDLY